ncbi:MAG: ABC transporter permease [Ignisphaera sp.]|nr:ABC transporter permease [Ignisphaera sp.]MDW8084712.1 ABC transporter permease [Ignisphaera sp.]
MAEVFNTIVRSVVVSGAATALASLWSIPLAYTLIFRSRGSVLLEAIIETLVGVPTVVLGLLLYILFSSSGPLGFLGLLYTPHAIIIGESILVTPLIVSMGYRSLRGTAHLYYELALSIGADRIQRMRIVVGQSLPGVVAACITGFSRAIGELGIAMMVGGNITGYTRVMTTAIALEVTKGNFEEAIILGVTLLLITISISVSVKLISRVWMIWRSS